MRTYEERKKAVLSTMSVGTAMDSSILNDICKYDFIPSGEFVMENSGQKVYFEGDYFVTRKDGVEVMRYSKSALSESQLDDIFIVWAANKSKKGCGTF